MSERIVVHRDHTFTYRGVKFAAQYGGPDTGWEVLVGDYLGPSTQEWYHSLEELRARFPRDFGTEDVQNAIDEATEPLTEAQAKYVAHPRGVPGTVPER